MLADEMHPTGPEAALRVCQVLEGGFAMLAAGVRGAGDVRSDAQLYGYDVDVRRAALAGLRYSVAAFASYGEVMARTRAGECDVGWATYFHTASRTQCADDPFLCRPLDDASANGTVDDWTPYRCCVDFGVNIWPAEIGVMYAEDSLSFFDAVFGMMSSPFYVNFLGFVFLWIVVIAHLVWLAERRHNPAQYPTDYLGGIAQAIWWGVVTFTTVGYGDKVPVTPAGKLLGMVWMLLGITMYGVLVGHQVTHFHDSLNDVSMRLQKSDLSGVKVCGYRSVFSSWFLPPSLGYQPIIADNVEACGERLQRGEVDLVVAERPHLLWYKNAAARTWDAGEVTAGSLRISDAVAGMPAGVAFPKNSTLRAELDLRLVRLSETPVLREAQARWFAAAPNSNEEHIQWNLVGPALGFVGLYLVLMGVLVAKKKNATMSSPDEVTTVPANVTVEPNGEQNPAWSSQQGKAQDGA